MRKSISLLAMAVLTVMAISSSAQTTYTNEKTIWFTGNLSYQLDSTSVVKATGQHRWFLDREGAGHWLGAATYAKQTGAFKLSTGVVMLDLYAGLGEPTGIVHNREWRPFVGINSKPHIGAMASGPVEIGLRVGLRILPLAGDDFIIQNKILAIRYRGLITLNLTKDFPVDIKLKLEPMLATSEQNTLPWFDQNRTTLEFGQSIGSLSMSAGYMHWFVQPASGVFQHRHTLVSGLSYKL